MDGEFAEVRGARVQDFVDAVANAHDLLLPFKFALDEGIDLVEIADLLEHVNDALVGAAVKRALERTDRCGDGGIHVRKCGDGDAGGEGGGVHAVIGMKGERDIEDAGCTVTGDLTVDKIEEVLGLREVFAYFRKVLTVAEAVVCGDDGGGFRAERKCDCGVCLHVRLPDFGPLIVEAEHGDGGAEDVHRRSVPGSVFQKIENLAGERAIRT